MDCDGWIVCVGEGGLITDAPCEGSVRVPLLHWWQSYKCLHNPWSSAWGYDWPARDTVCDDGSTRCQPLRFRCEAREAFVSQRAGRVMCFGGF